MILATWNLNSVRVRQPHLLDWLARARPDVLCLQELKVADKDFPLEAVQALGYHAAVRGQPTYNGVAILSLAPLEDVRVGMDDGVDDAQARLIAASTGGVRVLSAYFPNGGEVGSDKWAYKLAWMGRLRTHLERHYDPGEPLALCGDFNVAPDDRDVARPTDWADSVLCHPDARAALEALRAWGLVDVFRTHHPEGGVWSWWDYRGSAFARDDGLRIDHIWATRPLAGRCVAASIDRGEREIDKPSDHAPAMAGFELGPGAVVAGQATDSGARGAMAAPTDGALAGARSTAAGPTSAAEPAASGAAATTAASAARGAPATATAPTAPAARKLVIVDGHSLAYRAFYGLPLYDRRGKVSFSTASGEFTNAVYGFANMLIKTWNDERPDYIAVAFDAGRTFRDDLYEPYKGTRDKMPDELSPQIDRIVELVEAFDIPAITAEGFEADDILGTLATRAAADGIDVLIVTGDTDAFQLIGPRVRVLAPGRLWSDVAVWDAGGIERRYGLAPAQLIDFKALKGDTSDNIPGVKGIGEKTAQALLAAYASIEGIYAHLGEVTPDRARLALEAGRDMAFLSKDLITIRTDIPLDVRWADCAVHRYDRAKVEAFFDALEFRTIRNRLPPGGVGGGASGGGGLTGGGTAGDGTAGTGAAGASPATAAGSAGAAGTDASPAAAPPAATLPAATPPPMTAEGQMAMFGLPAAAPAPAAPRSERAPDTRVTVVDDPAGLDALVARLREAEIISFDVETTGTDPLTADLVGLALAVEPGAGHYIPVGHAGGEPQLAWAAVRTALAPVLEDPARPKVGHNAKYDMAVLRLAGIDVRGLAWDTMLAEFVIDASARLGLKALARARLGIEMTEITELIGTGRKQITMDRVPVAAAAAYAAADVDMPLRLMALQAPELDRVGLRRLLDDIDLPLVPVLLDMELAGVRIDTERLARLSERLAARLAEIEAEVYALVGTPFNLNSPQQLGAVLFEQLKLKAPGGRQTATGQASVAADVLETLRGSHPIIDLILEQRQITKLKGTYIDALPKLVNPRTGRVHTSFNQTGAVSGRLASQDPNLQNIPIRTELGREVRKAFVAPPGWKLIAADYSQVELRIAAHICHDPGLRAAFAAGDDIHRATAATVLGIAPEAVTADQRRFAKCVAGETLVATSMGLRPIASLVDSMSVGEYRPLNLEVETDEGRQSADQIYFGGRQVVRRIEVHGGMHLTCTLGHRIRVINDAGSYVWRYAEHLRVGDVVVLLAGARAFGQDYRLPAVVFPKGMAQTNYRDIELPTEWSPRLARFLGYVLSEGYLDIHPSKPYTAGVVISQSHRNPSIVTDLTLVTRGLFGDRVRISDRRGSRFFTISSSKLVYWLQKLGVGGRSADKQIPDSLLAAPERIQLEFLRAIFSGDGSLKRNGEAITYSTKSIHLAVTLQQVLFNFGYRFTLRAERRNGYPDPYYDLRLGSRADVRRFLIEIGFMTDRLSGLDSGALHDYTDIPNQLDHVRAIYSLLSGAAKSKAYEVLRSHRPVRLNHTRTTMMVQDLQGKGVDHSSLMHLAFLVQSGFQYARVTSIEESEADVYDLVVPSNHCYIANGFISHNTVNFGILYGMGAQALAQQTGSTMKEAQAFIEAYFAGFPNIKRYIDDTKRQAREQGYVETLLGRRRYFPVLAVQTRDNRTRLMQASAEREAVNHPMQGSAADIIKVAMLHIHAALAERGLRARLLLQVHDELVLEAPDDEVDAVVALVKDLMEGAYPLDPPLRVDVGVGASWDEVK